VLDGFGAMPIYSPVHEILARTMCNLIGRYDGVAHARVRRIESGEERRVELPVPYPMPHAPTLGMVCELSRLLEHFTAAAR